MGLKLSNESKNFKEKDFNIIIVDENTAYKNQIAAKLKYIGYYIEFATGGFHLMNMVENPDKNYHLVLIHNDMKDMSAYEMISLLREFKSKFDLPILFISQTVTEKEIKELLKAGINDFEFNPKEQKKVIEMVVKFFNQKKLSFQS